MSSVKINDMRGGKYEAVIEFSYGECERLPYNLLRRLRAKLKAVPGAGLRATTSFNIRLPAESAAFLELLNMFGEEGSFPHGSAADPAILARKNAPEGDPEWDDGDDELELDDAEPGVPA